jgi:hypothetical protein
MTLNAAAIPTLLNTLYGIIRSSRLWVERVLVGQSEFVEYTRQSPPALPIQSVFARTRELSKSGASHKSEYAARSNNRS